MMDRLRGMIRDARLNRGWSQMEAGRRTGFDRLVISELESGKRQRDLVEYSFRLSVAAQDWRLAKTVVDMVAGAPIAGVPMPNNIDHHPLAIRQLVGREIATALAAIDEIPYWRQASELDRQKAIKALEALWRAMSTCGWLFEALCEQFELEARGIMRRSEIVGLPGRVCRRREAAG